MADMKLVVTGAGGRMGKALISVVHGQSGAVMHGALERPGSSLIGSDAGEVAGVGHIGLPITDNALKAFVDADGVLDFTTPEASVEFAALSAQARIVHVIGTTGMGEEHREKIAAAARHATIVQSGNMSLGVNLLSELVEQAAHSLGPEDFDIEVTEMHHRHKVDAPSGTALLLGEAAARGRGIELASHSVRSRDGITGEREQGTIGFATLRGGSVVGEHSVTFAGEGERIVLSHIAQDRTIFARGGVRAALWARERKPGLYSMRHVLGLVAS